MSLLQEGKNAAMCRWKDRTAGLRRRAASPHWSDSKARIWDSPPGNYVW
eukprot:CAMPEP_0119003220 /NCGR_PEP_ID=MMETSP1176-20130426/433_1 /TAXON_ID=265551 /ORGANISM="Synedropsis recta cf, Strain CCMP1620" /LENGTH=48 /DNA_ID= /DNA_START= /DNA_END= /DNA_ORIENTATION=